MIFLERHLGHAAAVAALLWALPAGAQDIRSANKSPAQIFASDCSGCHKAPQALAKAGGPLGLGLESFLRNHYTATSQVASVMAKYIQSMEAVPAAAEKGTKRGATGAKSGAKKSDSKKGDAKPAVALPGDNKPVEAKPAEAKPVDAPKPAEPAKPAE